MAIKRKMRKQRKLLKEKMKIKIETVKKKVRFMEDVKKYMEVSMICNIDGHTFFCS